MTSSAQGGGCGCGALFAVLLVFGAVVAAGVSLAALVDPFAWMPSLAEVWEECDDNRSTAEDECALSARFDGFWLHVAVNLAYLLTAGVLLMTFAHTVADFRKAQRERFSGKEAAHRYAQALDALIGGAAAVAVVAAIPVVVAVL